MRFKDFSEHELYILKRQAIHSSWDIVMEENDNYDDQDRKVHGRLLNEVTMECRDRDRKREREQELKRRKKEAKK